MTIVLQGTVKRASCFMQDELNCDVARFTTYESNLSCNKSGSQVACVQIPPPSLPSEKNREECRQWIAVVNRVAVYICINYYFFCFASDNWKGVERLTRLWNLAQHVRSYYFFSEGRRRLSTGYSHGHGLKLEKVEPTFSSFDAMPAKITKKGHA